jgi:hypothetical protein
MNLFVNESIFTVKKECSPKVIITLNIAEAITR